MSNVEQGMSNVQGVGGCAARGKGLRTIESGQWGEEGEEEWGSEFRDSNEWGGAR